MSLTDEERDAIVTYRVERAQVSMNDVKDLVSMHKWSLVANRLYYTLYYVSIALLLKDGHATRTHKGMMTLINQFYVRTGVLSTEDSRLIKRMFDLRQESDYDDFIYVTEQEIMPFVPQVEALLNKVIELIRK